MTCVGGGGTEMKERQEYLQQTDNCIHFEVGILKIAVPRLIDGDYLLLLKILWRIRLIDAFLFIELIEPILWKQTGRTFLPFWAFLFFPVFFQ